MKLWENVKGIVLPVLVLSILIVYKINDKDTESKVFHEIASELNIDAAYEIEAFYVSKDLIVDFISQCSDKIYAGANKRYDLFLISGTHIKEISKKSIPKCAFVKYGDIIQYLKDNAPYKY